MKVISKSFKVVHLLSKTYCHKNQVSLSTSADIVGNFFITVANPVLLKSPNR